MVYKLADNILSPLGTTTEQNYQAVKAGRSALSRYCNHPFLPEPFTASLFSDEQNREMSIDGLTRFESLAVRSAKDALANVVFDTSDHRVVFILSSTKGNNTPPLWGGREGFGQTTDDGLAESASRICQALGISTQPIVVCNACISGASAIILGMRLLEAKAYDYAIVCGADVLNTFILSGFQSLKALSPNECRPFDMERLGLNLGEAAATIVLGSKPPNTQHPTPYTTPPLWGGREGFGVGSNAWHIEAGAVRNDAYHISSPSKKGDGAYLSLFSVIEGRNTEDLAFINAHGTATMFNDQMESVAIERAGLKDVPVNALKGYFGHTLGAAGILETVLSMRALDDNLILGTRGFEELGVSGKISVSATNQSTQKKSFLKMISGFGGCNAAIWATKAQTPITLTPSLWEGWGGFQHPNYSVVITPEQILVNGLEYSCSGKGKAMLTEAYKRYIDDYPKFYKMDMLSRLGFVASELLLAAEKAALKGQLPPSSETGMGSRAVILFNHSSTLCADRSYFETISDAENFFPSPSLFVYTLPNIVTGEIAIRSHYHGETAFYILREKDEKLMNQILQATLLDTNTQSILTGWLDYEDDQHFSADLYIINTTHST
ncbi:MAG: 3-oxoacyl-ACP synthase [Prevotella sp.]|nr:3-oxoacyl-ACP synthase [Prevotella sp.]